MDIDLFSTDERRHLHPLSILPNGSVLSRPDVFAVLDLSSLENLPREIEAGVGKALVLPVRANAAVTREDAL